MEKRAIRVMVVDDHSVARKGIRVILGEASDIEVIVEAASASAALGNVDIDRVDVAIIDLSLPGTSGMELLRALRLDWPGIRVLVFTAYTEDAYAVRSLKNGADGYLNKGSSVDTLISAVRKIARGGKFFTETIGERMVAQLREGSQPGRAVLSRREMQVMSRLALGQPLHEIAAALFLSPKTITTHRARIFAKLAVSSNAELTRYALEEGWVK